MRDLQPHWFWSLAASGLLTLGGGACSTGRQTAIEPIAAAPASSSASPAVVAAARSGSPEALVAPERDLLKIARTAGLAPEEWTLSDRDLSFDRVASSPRGGFVVHGTEGRFSNKHFLLRIADDGAVRWAVRFSRGGDVVDPCLAVDDDGSIALLAQHTGGLVFEGRDIVHGEDRAVVVSLLLLEDSGELKQALSRGREASDFSRRIVGGKGFVTSSLDLIDPYQGPDHGLLALGNDGHEERREITGLGLQPRLLATGAALVVVGEQQGTFTLRGRTIAASPPKDHSAWIVASFGADLGLQWAHPFTDRRVREATALAQDERGHVFVALRYGVAQGFSNDPFSAIVYELDEHGREVHHFMYGPDVSLAHLFPAPDGLTVLGYSWQLEVRFKGAPLVWPLGDSSHDDYPDLLLRVDPEGKPLGQREYREPSANISTVTHQTTITDVAAAGPTFLVTVGRITRGAPFAGLSVAKGEPELSYVARIRRP